MVPADALRWSQVSTRLGLRIAVAAFVALGWRSTAGAASAQYEGQVIAAIQFDPEQQPLKLDQLLALIPLHTGEHMRGSGVRDAIQRLYATGEYADIAVDATLVAAGVNLKFMTKPAYFVGHVKVVRVS